MIEKQREMIEQFAKNWKLYPNPAASNKFLHDLEQAGWNPYPEKKPENKNNKYYLTTISIGEVCKMRYEDKTDSWYSYGHICEIVIAWRELPDAYVPRETK